ncbi:MAG: 3-hydroxyacyl-CoA dehydrogenase NAD-binding domain-containing protein [Syntrophales bacterium]|nr:3-hydroxyacyl-CoA dehydrogenase NAD-binding domain-containing protein [Syntrophales bacterium]
MDVKKVVVLGAGAMGHGIAQVAAMAGYKVVLRDINEEFVQRGYQRIKEDLERRVKKGRMAEAQKNDLLAAITPIVDLKKAVKDADIIVEAVPEIMKLKHEVLSEAAKLCPKKTVFATNTSSLSITEIAKVLDDPGRVVGLHFFNPVPVMKLVEIIYGEKTDEKSVQIIEAFTKKLGKTSIYVRKDVPGFVVNRIFVPFSNEAAWVLHNKEVATPFEVDAAIKYRLGLPMGMLELLDVLGNGAIDVQYHVSNYFKETIGESWGPPTNLTELFKAGLLGKKSGKGFYDWSDPANKNEIPLSAGRTFDPLRVVVIAINEAANLLVDKVATKSDIDVGTLLGLGFPRGILRMADDIGLDVVVDELNRLYAKFKEARYKASSLLVKMVKEGKTGRKAGQGFYSAAEPENIKFAVDDKMVATLTLNRPQRANALNLAFLDEINAVLDVVEKDVNIRCLIITGAGKNFCAGADMSGFASGIPGDMMRFSDRGHEVFTRLETLSKPVIAAINGAAMGGGLELALACDLRIMSSKAFVQLPEVNLGLFPGWGGTQRLPRLIGMGKAKQAIFMTEKIDAQKALDYGLANFIAEPEGFAEFVQKTAETLSKTSPLGLKMAKKIMYYGAQADQRTGLFLEGASSGDVCTTDDISEGITAFMNKRPAVYKGR